MRGRVHQIVNAGLDDIRYGQWIMAFRKEGVYTGHHLGLAKHKDWDRQISIGLWLHTLGVIIQLIWETTLISYAAGNLLSFH